MQNRGTVFDDILRDLVNSSFNAAPGN
ncbi:hypothetical protein ARTHRO8AJ_40153 [Arthrobacter sp. 8AJ]|nr:hypothetical protein ARTHRO8AJ_40153 [Arthrobacter sp. 8AJ]